MSLWGASDADESKPKFLTDAEKKEVFANASGWVQEAGSAATGNDNASADPEVLVAIGGLATSIGAADITEIEFITTSVSAAAPGAFSVRVRFNEPVDVVTTGGTPTVTVVNDNAGTSTSANIAPAYASGTGTNELVFTVTWTNELLEGDVLSIGTNALTLNSGTIKDAGTATNSTITNAAGIGTAGHV
jgi:hypothetical protein